jgi:hypothetical protein
MTSSRGFSGLSANAGARERTGRHSSSVNPTLIVTCQYATLPSSMKPRVSVTSNQCMPRSVLLAREIALLIASSTLYFDEPVSSMYL